MALERYARGQWRDEQRGLECHPGVEYRDGDDVEQMTIDLQIIAQQSLFRWGGNHAKVAEHARELIESQFPGGAFFVETEENGRGVQVYDPRDFVKGRCTCSCARRPKRCPHNQTDLWGYMCDACRALGTPE